MAQTAQDVAQAVPDAPPAAETQAHAELIAALGAVEQHKASASEPTEPRSEVYFIDRTVEEADTLAQSLPPGAELHYIEPGVDGLRFIADTLNGRQDVDAIHILSHGEAGMLQLGTATLTLESMQGEYRDELMQIGAALSADADVLLYGCDFGQGEAGEAAVHTLAVITGADVAASTDTTGALALGGDWTLERQSGSVEAVAVSAQDWNYALAPPVLNTLLNLSYTGVEDAPAPVGAVGTTISAYTAGLSDVDPGALKGIALTAANATNGTWWYTLDGGTNWTAVGTVSGTSALLLSDTPDSRIYFQSNTNFNGSAGNALTLRGWDQSAGTAGTKVNPTTITGAVSIASDTVAVTVTAVNDAPVLNVDIRNLSTINEDLNASVPAPAPTGGVGTSVNNFIESVSDIDSGSLTGVAIVGADTANGTWWYSINNGTTWAEMGTLSDSNALLLVNSGDSHVYFRPNADYNGTASLTIRAWDQTSGTNGGTADASVNGGTTAYSSATGAVNIIVNPIVDIVANTATTAEETAVIINVLANDSFENSGRAVTAINGTAITVGGPAVSVANGSVVLNADGTITFTPGLDFPGAAASANTVFTYTATSAGVSETANVTVTVTQVQDAPRIDLDGMTLGADYSNTLDEGTAAIGRQVSVTDPENNNLASMTISLSGAMAGDLLTLGGTVTGITASYNSGTGVLTLSGNTTLANYQTALGLVNFSTTSGSTAARTISVQATSALAPTASNVAVSTITPIDTDGDGVANTADLDDDNDGILDSVESLATTPSLIDGSMEGALGVAHTENESLNFSIDGTGFTDAAATPDTWKGTFSLAGSGQWAGAMNGVPGAAEGQVFMAIYSGFVEEAAQMIIPASAGIQVGDVVHISFQEIFGGVNGETIPGMEAYFIVTVDGVSYNADTLTYNGNNFKTWSTGGITFTATSTAPVVVFSIGRPNGGDGAYLGLDDVRVYKVSSLTAAQDRDGDGLVDRLDLDSDNDGITDNVEAQSTAGYQPPSGQGMAMVDVDDDGLDDRYDADTVSVNRTTEAASLGLTPVDSDADGTTDVYDADSDNDGTADVAERGDGQATSVTSTTDTDQDGLLDIFEHGTVNDGFDVRDGNVITNGSGLGATVTGFTLSDSDGDMVADGSNAQVLSADLDWRDSFVGVAPPVALADSATAVEDTPLSVSAAAGLLANDTFNRDGSLTAASYDSNADGTPDTAITVGAATTLLRNGIPTGILTLNADGSYTFAPAANYDGLVPLVRYTITTPGGSSNGDLSLAITPVNDAPVLADTSLTVVGVMPSNGAPSNQVGILISDLVGGVTDADTGAVKGVAVTAINSSGTLYYSLNNGANWTQVTTLTEATARLLAADGVTRLYFRPNTGVVGNVADALTFRAWDQTSGTNGGTGDATVNGAATAYSGTTDTILMRANTAPVLDTSLDLLYTGLEDAPTPTGAVGVLVSHFTAGLSDADAGALKGVAIISITGTHGDWWYTLDGGTTWTAMGSVSTSNALLLPDDPNARIYYVPDPGFTGDATIEMSLRGWDQSSGTAGTKVTIGTSNAFSSASDSVEVFITNVNDAPVLNVATRNLTTINEDLNASVPAPVPTGAVGTSVNNFIGSTSDADSGALTGVAIVGADATNGTWWYSINNGTNWTQMSAVSDTSALLLINSSNSRVYFRPNADYNGTAPLTIRAWDQTSGANGATADASVNGGDTAFSSMTASVGLLINAIADIAPDTLVSTEDTAVIINVLGNDTFENSGRFISAINGTAITAGGAAVSVANGSVVLNVDGTLTFTPNADYPGNLASGTVNFTYTVTSGVMTETANVMITVTQVQDAARVDLNGATAGFDHSTTYDQTTISIGNLVSVTDPENQNLSSMTITLSGATAADVLALGGAVPGITANYNSGTGVLTLTGNTTLANYQTALGLVTFTTTSTSATTRTISVQATSVAFPTASNVAVTTITLLDSDGDGATNLADIDDDNDGILDINESGDTDADGIVDRLDLDSDNDGITDNVEAQTTAGYLPPSGQGASIVDVDQDGLDDRYDADTVSVNRTTAAASLGLTPVNTDGDGLADYRDTDSDNDGVADVAERGDGQPTSVTSTTDTDQDGLLDIFEHGTPNDGYVVQDGNVVTSGSGLATTVVSFNLGDTDVDTAIDGSNAVPLTRDFDWRDGLNNPAIDLNSTVGAADGLITYSTSQIGAGAAVNTAAATADVSDIGDTDIQQLAISVSGVQDGANEILTLGGTGFALDATATQTVTVDSVDLLINYTVAGGFVITRSGGGVIAHTVLDTLVRGATYGNTLLSATAGARLFGFVVTDTGGATSASAVSTVQVTPGNRPPVPADPAVAGQTFDPVTGNYAVSATEDTAFNGQVTATDADNDTLTYAVTTQPLHGTVMIDAMTGMYTYTPVADYNGSDSFVVTVSDGFSSTVASTVNLTVAAVADIANDTITTNEDTTVNIAVSGNDNFDDAGYVITAIDGIAVVVDTPVGVANGTVTLKADGTLDFTPTPNYNGLASFTYTVTSAGTVETATVSVTVTAVADAPMIVDPAVPGQTFDPATGNYAISLNEDGAFAGQVSAVDGDGDTLVYGVDTPATHGSVTVDSATGAYTYTPTADYYGSDSFVISIDDGAGNVILSTVTVTVAAVVDIADDTVTTDEDTTVNIAVVGNDSFENAGRTITAIDGMAVVVGTPVAVANGSVTLKADGTLDFDPALNYNGSTSFTYTVTSGGAVETASVTVTVTAVADAPMTVDPAVPGQVFDPATGNYAISLNEDGAFTGQVSAVDGDGDTLTYSVSSAATQGMVTVDPATGAYTYTPTADYYGSDSFIISIDDGEGNVTQSTVSVTVAAVVDIVNDTITTDEDTPVNIVVVGNDSFENAGRAITAIDGNAVVVGTPVAVANGAVTLKADGTLDFAPAANYNGSTSFTYTVTSGGAVETATVTVTVTAVADVPVTVDPAVPGQVFDAATGNYAISLNEDAVFNGQVSAVDGDGDTLTYGVDTPATHGMVTVDPATGAYTYTPSADYYGSDSFIISIDDGAGNFVLSTVSVTVAAVVDITDDTITTNEDTTVNIAVVGNDSFENAGHAITAIDGMAVVVGAPVVVANGSVTLKADGTLDFAPAANYNGSTSFTYTVTSGGVVETAMVTVTVTAVADAPMTVDPAVPGQTFDPATGNYAISLNEDAVFNGQVSAVDGDGDTLAYGVDTPATHGMATVDPVTGAYTYTPTSDYYGSDSFIISIDDGAGNISLSTVTVTVVAVADITDDTITTDEDTTVNIVVVGNDSFENAGRTITAIDGYAVVVGTPVAVANGSVTLKADGTLDFAPAANYNGSTSFTYTVTSGGALETASVTVTVTAVADAPMTVDPAVPDQVFDPATGNYAISLNEDGAFTGQVSAVDGDGDTLTYSVSAAATHGMVTVDPTTGAYTYTPTADYYGSDSFIISIDDGAGNISLSAVTVTVVAVVDITDDTITTNEDMTVNIAVVGNDSFENVGRAITAIDGIAVVVGAPVLVNNGSVTLKADGTLDFAPAANYNGSTSFTYTVTSGGVVETATVTVTVTAVADAPMTVDPAVPGQTFDPATGNYAISLNEDAVFNGQVSAVDGDGDSLAYGVDTPATHGVVTVDPATGAYTYTPTADYYGADSFVISIDDGAGNIILSTVSVTVAAVVDITDDTITTNEDTTVNIAVVGNDSFENAVRSITAIDGNAILVGIPVAVANGSVTLKADGTLDFAPTANYNGSTSFTYTVTSGGAVETATVTVTVTAVADAPMTVDPAVPGQVFDPATGNYAISLNEDAIFNGQVSAVDGDGDPLTYSVSSAATHGMVTVDPTTGAYTYTPTADYYGADSFIISIDDGEGNVTQSTVSVTVAAVVDTTDDTITTNEDTTVNIAVVGNDSFENAGRSVTAIDGIAAMVGVPVLVSNGSVTLKADGTLDFAPAANYNGSTSFTYTVTSGGADETATVTVTVTAVADAPMTVDPAVPGQTFDPATGNYEISLNEDAVFNGQVSAVDGDGDTLTYSVSSAATHGMVTVDPATGAYTYTPTADYYGSDSFIISIDDGAGNVTQSTVSVTVVAVVDITDDTITTDEDTTVNIAVVGNDSFENAGRIISAIDGNAVMVGTPVAVANGSVTLKADGTLDFTPATDFNGPTSFTYTVTSGGAVETATVTVTVTAVADVPVTVDPAVPGQVFDPATGNYAISLNEDAVFNGQVSAVDGDGDTLAYGVDAPATHGVVTLDPVTGAYTYTPTSDYYGSDSFIISIDDGAGNISLSTVTVTVAAVADIADDTITTNEDTTVNIAVVGNDSFENAGHAITAIDGIAVVVGTPVLVANGSVTLKADGTLDFTPATDYNGSTSFTYTVTSGGAVETATVTVTVTAVADAPIAVDPAIPGQVFDPATGNYAVSLNEDAVFNGQVSAVDGDGDTLTYSVSSAATHGMVTVDPATGSYTYTPTADYYGSDSFIISIDDGAGNVTQSTVSVTVSAVVDITDDTITTNEDTTVNIAVVGNDSFENAGRIITAIDGNAVMVGTPVAVANGSVTLKADGTLDFAPAANYNGLTSFTYTVTSGGAVETASVTITVTAVADVPVTVDPAVPGQTFDPATGNYAISLNEDGAFTGQVSAVDGDGDTLLYSVNSAATHGMVTVDPATGAYTYTPTADYTGSDSFIISIDDGEGNVTQSTVSVTVAAVADITDDAITTNEDTTVNIAVFGNDSFENAGHAITAIDGIAVVVGAPVLVANGSVTLKADGTLDFTPATDYNGSTSFTYTVTSGGAVETATVAVTVTAVADAPIAVDPAVPGQVFDPATGNYVISLNEDAVFSGQVLAVDGDGDTLVYSVSAVATHGMVTVDAVTGAYTYTPTADYYGADSFIISIDDGEGNVTQSTVSVTVAAVVDITHDTITTNEDTTVNIAVVGNDSFENAGRAITAIDGMAVVVGTPVLVSNGSVTLKADGTLDFAPAANYNGLTSFTYTVTSGGAVETASVTITVTAVADVPVTVDPAVPGQTFDPATGNYAISLNEDGAFAGQVSAVDGDGDTLVYGVDTPATHGSVTVDSATGAYTYTPTADYYGSDSFVISIDDGAGNVILSTVTVTVAAVVDIADDTITTNEDTTVNIAVVGNDSFENAGHAITAIDGNAILVGTPVAVMNGSVTLKADGTLDFAPSADFNGSTSFTYTVTSGGAVETASVTVTVTAVADVPVTVDPAVPGQTFDPATGNYAISLNEDAVFNGQVSAVDGDGDTLTYGVSATATHGMVTVDPTTGAYTYTPTADYYGADSFVISIDDGEGNVTQSTVSVTVSAVVDITSDTITTAEDTTVNIPVFGNDSFENAGRSITAIDGNAVVVGTPVAVTNGSVTLKADGTLDFTPTTDFNGSTGFTYTVTSGGAVETASVTVTVTAVADAPMTVDPVVPGQTFDPATGNYAISLNEDAVFNGQVSAVDDDGDTLTYSVSSTATRGMVTVDSATGAYTYTPASDYYGTDSFIISIDDGMGSISLSTVTVTVAVVADIADDTITTNEDTTVNIAVFGNDSFENAGRSITAIDGNAIMVGTPVAVANGSVTLKADGTIDFTPATDFNGPTNFTYTVTSGGAVETATVTVTVTAVADAPMTVDPAVPGQTFDPATGNYTISLNEDGAFSGQVSAVDGDGDTLAYGVDTPATYGMVVVDPATGAYTYTPTADYYGADSFIISIDDGAGNISLSTVTVTVAAVVDITSDTITTNEDTPVNIAVVGNDSFENAGRSITAIDGNAVIVGTPVAVANGSVTLKADGTLDFAPSADFNGSTSFTYTVTSGGAVETASVTVTVTAVADAPMAVDPVVPGQTFDPATGNYAISLNEDGAFTGQVSAVDGDGDTLLYSVNTPATHGMVMVDPTTGAYTYTPTADYYGSDSFIISIDDGEGNVTLSTVSVTVAAVVDILNDTVTTNEDTTVNIAVVGNDSFENAGRSITAIDGTAILVGMPVAVANGSVTLKADGTIDFTPTTDFNGPTSFTYTVTSGGAVETATVTVTVTAVADAPVTVDPAVPGQTFDPATGNYAISLNEDAVFSGQVSAVDGDGDTLIYGVSTSALHGMVTVDPATGAYTYTPTADYYGADSFIISMDDGTGNISLSTVTVTVAAVVDITSDTITTNEDTTVNIAVVGNDTFENAGFVITAIDGNAVVVGTPIVVANGSVTLKADGTLDFAPTANYNGSTSFTYTVTSGGAVETATVTVTVTAVADVPMMVDPAVPGQTFDPATGNYAVSAVEDTAFNGQVSAVDGDGDTLVYSVSSAAMHGMVTVDPATGAYTYTPTGDYYGADSFIISIDDGQGNVTQSTVSVTVAAVVDIANDTVTTNEDTAVNIAVFGNDSFENAGRSITAIDGNAIVVGTPVAVANGSVTLKADGTLDFLPGSHFHGSTSFTYTVTSGGVTETATATINVTAINDVPILVDVRIGGQVLNPVTGEYGVPTTEDTSVAGRVEALDSDGEPLQYTVTTLPAHGAVTLNAATGDYVYTAIGDFHGNDRFVVTITDGSGGLVQTVVNVTVGAIVDIDHDTVTTNEDTPVNIAVQANNTFENAGHVITAIDGSAVVVGTPVAVANGLVTLRANGTLDFAPSTNYNGTTTFTYTVTSGGVTETANVTVNVTAVNDSPVVPAVAVSLPLGGGGLEVSADGGLLAGASDVDGDPLRVTEVSVDGVPGSTPAGSPLAIPGGGTLLVRPDGSYVFTPSTGFTGELVVRYRVSDGNGGFTESTFTLRNSTPLFVEQENFLFVPQSGAGESNIGGNAGLSANEVSSVLINAVNRLGSLNGTADLPQSGGAVLRAVNGVNSLDHLGTFDALGAVLQAVNDISPLNGSGDMGARGGLHQLLGAGLGGGWGDSQAVLSTLPLGGGLQLDLMGRGDQLLFVINGGDGKADMGITLANGAALPAWVQADGRGVVLINRPAGVETLSLRLTSRSGPNAGVDRVITIDFLSGTMREQRAPGDSVPRPQTAPDRTPGAAAAAPVRLAGTPFSVQLEQAARQHDVEDIALMDLLD
nr:tandem-95 repeat protein [Achromobacter spanius]